MSRVFIPHEPLERDRRTGGWRRRFDLEPARRYGVPTFLLANAPGPSDFGRAVERMREGLADLAAGDFILPCGAPPLIGAVCAIAAALGPVNMLVWDKLTDSYSVWRYA